MKSKEKRKRTVCLTMIALSVGVMSLSSCYYDIETELYGAGCPDAVATYNTSIQFIFSSQCATCHSGATPDGGLLLTQYAEIADATLNGAVIDRISRNAGSSGAMPPHGPIDPCKIDLIKQWATNGVPE